MVSPLSPHPAYPTSMISHGFRLQNDSRRPQLGPPYAAAAFGTFSTGVFGRGAAFSVHAVRKRFGKHTILQSGGYPLVNIQKINQKTMERSTQSPIYSWEKTLFRLDHFPCRFLYVYQSVSCHWSLGPFNQIAVHRSRSPRKTPKEAVKQVLLPPLWMYLSQNSRVPIIRYPKIQWLVVIFRQYRKGNSNGHVSYPMSASSGQITAAHPVKIPSLKTKPLHSHENLHCRWKHLRKGKNPPILPGKSLRRSDLSPHDDAHDAPERERKPPRPVVDDRGEEHPL